MKNKNRTIAIVLSIIWVFAYLVFDLLSYLGDAEPVSPFLPLSVSECLFYCVTLFFLYPLLFIIRHNAKRAEMKRLCRVTLLLIVIVSIWYPMYMIGLLALNGS